MLGLRCEDRRANGGGGAFFDTEDGCSETSGLGVGSLDASLDAFAKASRIAFLGTGTGGSGLLNSPDDLAFLVSSTGLDIDSAFEKSSNATICGPDDTDFPCLCLGSGGFTRLLCVRDSDAIESSSSSDIDRS